MRDFWSRYLLVAVVGTLIVYHGAPRLLPPPSRDAVPAVAPAVPSRLPARTPAAPLPSPPSTPLTPSTPSTPPPPLPVAPVFRAATADLPSSGSGVTHWGVTTVNAACYTLDGKRRDDSVAGGTIVELTGIKASSRGEMAICRIARPGGAWVGPYLLAASELVRFPGTRDRVDAALIPTLQRYFMLNAQIEARRQALQPAPQEDNNPLLARARQALGDYRAAQQRAAELTSLRDRASGGERTRYADELRDLVAEQARLKEKLEDANAAYREWKVRHGGASTTVAASAQPEDENMRAWQREMAALRPRLADLGL